MRKLLLNLFLILVAGAAGASAQIPLATDMPIPLLERKAAVAPDTGSDGKPYIRVSLGVVNYQQFGALFARAPRLAPCGENKNASRTWVHVFDAETGAELYGYCAMTRNADLQNFSFLVPRDKLPKSVFVVFEDRLEKQNQRSNCVNLAGGNPCTISPTTKIALSKKIAVWNAEKVVNPKVLTVSKPDLHVSDFWMSPDKNQFTVRFKNRCQAAATGSFSVALTVHEGKDPKTKVLHVEKKTMTATLQGGFSTDLTFDISKVAKGKDIRGTHLLRIAIDPDDTIAEQNENNNNVVITSLNQGMFPEPTCEQP